MRLIELTNVSKTYDGRRYVLKNLNINIGAGEYVQIVGKSGSGKSTLLNLIGLLDTEFDGELLIDGQDIAKISDYKVSGIRSKRIGFIFQSYNLVNHMTVLENIYLPILYSKNKDIKEFLGKVELLLNEFEIDTIKHIPIQFLSGGEKQRVAIARALAMSPEIILADEPTGNLDKENSEIIFSILKKLSNQGKTIILVSHNCYDNLKPDRIMNLQNGALI